jgi:hypothetical protein
MLAKQSVQSSQRNWSAYYGQNHVYDSSSFKYENDFLKISKIVKPGTVLFSDLATSYYAAGYLPVYVKNTHRHQGRNRHREWKKFLDDRRYCYLGHEDALRSVRKFVKQQKRQANSMKQPELKYILVNRDSSNQNLRNDCFSMRHKSISKKLPQLSKVVYQGQYLDLYEL